MSLKKNNMINPHKLRMTLKISHSVKSSGFEQPELQG